MFGAGSGAPYVKIPYRDVTDFVLVDLRCNSEFCFNKPASILPLVVNEKEWIELRNIFKTKECRVPHYNVILFVKAFAPILQPHRIGIFIWLERLIYPAHFGKVSVLLRAHAQVGATVRLGRTGTPIWPYWLVGVETSLNVQRRWSKNIYYLRYRENCDVLRIYSNPSGPFFGNKVWPTLSEGRMTFFNLCL